MNSFYILCGIAAAVWLLSLAAGGLALRWSIGSAPRRFRAAIVAAVLALIIGYLGMTRFHFSYSRTVNGAGWSLDSKWFFLVPLAVGALSLVCVLWTRMKSSPRAQS